MSLPIAGGVAQDVQVAIDTSGDVLVAWESEREGQQIIQAASKPARERWQPPATIRSAPGSSTTRRLHAALGGDGEGIIVWESEPRGSGPLAIQAALRRSGAARWQTPVTLSSGGGEGEDPQVAINQHGEAIAVWEQHEGIEGRGLPGPRSEVIQAATLTPGRAGSWQTPVDLSSTVVRAEDPQLALNARGEALVAWEDVLAVEESSPTKTTIAGLQSSIVQAARRRASGVAWSAPVSLSTPANFASEPQVALNAAGNAAVIWQQDYVLANSILAVSASSPGAWQQPTPIARWRHQLPPLQYACLRPLLDACKRRRVRLLPGAEPQVALSADGDAVAIWEQASGYDGTIQAARSAGNRGWRMPIDLSPSASEDPRIAVDAHARATAAWRQAATGASQNETVVAARTVH